jgi:hypothetical protein
VRAARVRQRQALGHVLTLHEEQIQEITAFVSPDTFQRFGLPMSVAG